MHLESPDRKIGVIQSICLQGRFLDSAEGSWATEDRLRNKRLPLGEVRTSSQEKSVLLFGSGHCAGEADQIGGSGDLGPIDKREVLGKLQAMEQQQDKKDSTYQPRALPLLFHKGTVPRGRYHSLLSCFLRLLFPYSA